MLFIGAVVSTMAAIAAVLIMCLRILKKNVNHTYWYRPPRYFLICLFLYPAHIFLEYGMLLDTSKFVTVI